MTSPKPLAVHRSEADEQRHIVLPGAPRTKKNSGTFWMVGKKKVLRPSPYWMAWRDAVEQWWLELPVKTRRAHQFGPDVLLNCRADFYRDALRGDAVGYYQGLADVLQELKIVPDDKQIISWNESQLCLDHKNPRVELWLTPVRDWLGAKR